MSAVSFAPLDGEAVAYCEGAFDHTDGKTAHGLVRFTRRYKVVAVIDSKQAGKDAGQFLDGKANGIPIVASLNEASRYFTPGTKRYFVVGLAVLGGRLVGQHRLAVNQAIEAGFNVDCGLHDFLTEDAEFSALAREKGVTLRDVRKPPERSQLHAFSGKIEEVKSLKIAMLGTDSAIGKRTTAWKIVEGFNTLGISAEMVGTGQTAWLQGAHYSVCMDALINDFVAGELEHATWSAWNEKKPQAIVIEGQGSMLNPAYPGGFEIIAATRPDVIVLQHAPARKHYEDFPQYPIHALDRQIHALEIIADKPVVMITINRSGIPEAHMGPILKEVGNTTGLPCIDPLASDGPVKMATVLSQFLSSSREKIAANARVGF